MAGIGEMYRVLGRYRTWAKVPIPGLKKEAPTVRRRIVDEVVDLFAAGYNAALERSPTELCQQIGDIPHLQKAVMLEGACMALASADMASGGNCERLQEFLQVSPEYEIAVNEGVGHALCQQRLPVRFGQHASDSFWGWMALDGYGMHAAYFRWPTFVIGQKVPEHLDELGRAGFDNGVGRGLWFASGAEPRVVRGLIERFPHERRPNIWSGVGMMVAFWGAAEPADMRKLLRMSGKYRFWFQQGVAFSLVGRARANDCPDFTHAAASLVCGGALSEALDLTNSCLAALEVPPTTPESFNNWRVQTMNAFATV